MDDGSLSPAEPLSSISISNGSSSSSSSSSSISSSSSSSSSDTSNGSSSDFDDDDLNLGSEVSCCARICSTSSSNKAELEMRALRLKKEWEQQLVLYRRLVREVKHSRRIAEMIRRDMVIAERAISNEHSVSEIEDMNQHQRQGEERDSHQREREGYRKENDLFAPFSEYGDNYVYVISSTVNDTCTRSTSTATMATNFKNLSDERRDVQLSPMTVCDTLTMVSERKEGSQRPAYCESKRPVDNLTDTELEEVVRDICARFVKRPVNTTAFISKSSLMKCLRERDCSAAVGDSASKSMFQRFMSRVRNSVYSFFQRNYLNDPFKLSRERNIPLHVAKILLERTSVLKKQHLLSAKRNKVKLPSQSQRID